jgi:hypothetical protein
MHMIHDPQEPMAWAVLSKWYAGPVISADEAAARSLAKGGDTVAPLYPQPTLTDAERKAIQWAARQARLYPEFDPICGHAATLRGLLERLRGGR